MTLTTVLTDIANEGGPEEQIGSITEPPYFWAGLFVFTDAERVDGLWESHFDVEGLAGAILYCDENGFYSSEGFRSAESLQRAWEGAVTNATQRETASLASGEWCDTDARLLREVSR